MIVILLTYFFIYSAGLGLIVLVGLSRQISKERRYRNQDAKIDINEIVVLIPYRNEAKRIDVLLSAILRLKQHPSKYVFIDDHSNDGTDDLIIEKLNGLPIDILKLLDGITGKKRALRYAIDQTNEKYILTWDADVVPEPDYFDQLGQLGAAEMYVLPAVLVADQFMKRFYEIDVILVNAVNSGLAGLSRPIMSSGANFFYERQAFLEADNYTSHAHAASGDDTYLLRDFRLNEKDVRLVSDRRNAITTETPVTFKEFIDQRLRWIGKTGDLKDNLSTYLALFQSVLSILYIAGLIYFVITGELYMAMLFYGLKTTLDLLLFLPFFLRIRRMMTWVLIPLYELLFPFYNILILLLLFVYKPQWKGRDIYIQKKAP